MTVSTLTPDATSSPLNASVVGAASAAAALSDGSDSSYVSIGLGGAFNTGSISVDFTTVAMPAGSVVTGASITYRAMAVGSFAGELLVRRVENTNGYGQIISPGVIADYTSPHTSRLGVPVQSQADVDGFRAIITSTAFNSSPVERLYEVRLVVTYVPLPTVDITTPTGSPTITDTSMPLVAWTHTPGSDAQTGQTRARLRVFTPAQYGVGGFDPGVSPNTYAADLVGSASSASVGPLSNGTYRVYVSTAQTSAGVDQWSAWDFEALTINVPDVELDSVVASAPTAGQVDVTIERHVADPAWNTVEVEMSTDAGVTWVPVRSSPYTPTDPDELVIVDHEAPANTEIIYRARAQRIVSTLPIVGPWEESAPITWTLAAGEGAWIKDPDHVERNVQTCLTVVPEPEYDRAVGVFRPVGAAFPIVVSDVVAASTTTVEILVRSDAQLAAMRTLLSAPVLLLEMPPEYGWGSRYVAPTRITVRRVGVVRPGRPNPDRLVNVSLIEVARP